MASILAFLIKYKAALFCLAICVGCFGFGWYVKGVFIEASTAAAIKEAMDAKDAAIADRDKLSAKFEQEKTAHANDNASFNQQLEKELAKNHSYTACVVPPSGVRLLNRTISAGSPTR